ncbi:MAG TPA: hypothetical protein VGH43_17160 [Jatrophihabitans sp.]
MTDGEQFEGRPPLADEAFRLLGVLQDWTRQTFPPPARSHDDTHAAAVCDWCPVCQFMAVLRGERPEVTERVTEAGAAVAAALRAVLDAAASSRPAGEPEEAKPPRVQRIDLGPNHDGQQ